MTVWVAVALCPDLEQHDILGVGYTPEAAQRLCERDADGVGATIKTWDEVRRADGQPFRQALESRPAHDVWWRIEEYGVRP